MSSPRVTIGMVVRNGERHIAGAIESFLAQTMPDFTLVVHDNASTDATCSIVEAIARRDARVTLQRRSVNIGVLRNLIHAADAASTELFCWAACDDLREPAFLQELASLLEAHADVGLACCAVRNIDPDGTPRDVRPETVSLRTTSGMTQASRVRIYLRDMPGTPFYGLFRTERLRASLNTLHDLAAITGDGPPLLGLDMIVLARFVRDHGLAYTPEPLLRFRRGGMSHDIGRYRTLASYFAHLRAFRRELRRATRLPDASMSERWHVHAARACSMTRWMASREMRSMTSHYLVRSLPGAKSVAGMMRSIFDPDLRRLRRRLGRLGDDTRIVLYGAGKHTRRRLQDLRRAVRGRAVIVGACDDHAAECEEIDDCPIVKPEELSLLRPDVLLVSSDAYEETMHRRARTCAASSTHVWCLYDVALEAAANGESATAAPVSTLEMKAESSSSVPVSA